MGIVGHQACDESLLTVKPFLPANDCGLGYLPSAFGPPVFLTVKEKPV
jgi:hypothetical protein